MSVFFILRATSQLVLGSVLLYLASVIKSIEH